MTLKKAIAQNPIIKHIFTDDPAPVFYHDNTIFLYSCKVIITGNIQTNLSNRIYQRKKLKECMICIFSSREAIASCSTLIGKL